MLQIKKKHTTVVFEIVFYNGNFKFLNDKCILLINNKL